VFPILPVDTGAMIRDGDVAVGGDLDRHLRARRVAAERRAIVVEALASRLPVPFTQPNPLC
jgi:hypothetical protein